MTTKGCGETVLSVDCGGNNITVVSFANLAKLHMKKSEHSYMEFITLKKRGKNAGLLRVFYNLPLFDMEINAVHLSLSLSNTHTHTPQPPQNIGRCPVKFPESLPLAFSLLLAADFPTYCTKQNWIR